MVTAFISMLALVSSAQPTWPAPPFQAQPRYEGAAVRRAPDASAPLVGALREGDRVVVTGCVPACAPGAWALLDEGAVRIDHLELAGAGPDALGARLYATVNGTGEVYERPDRNSELVATETAGIVLSFNEHPGVEKAGWLERSDGGYMEAKGLRIHKPSPLVGERHPTLPLAFFLKEVPLQPEDGGIPYEWIPRHARLHAESVEGQGRVRVEGGTVSRSAVRLAFARPRPAQIPIWASWVHVDLSEQVLTAYEGDTPVFATLVSTGAPGRETSLGVFQVDRKIRRHAMASERWGYYLDEVPNAMFFHGSEGIHAAYWHDTFGKPVTHGCVNLALEDAAWLFDWAPPRVPAGWNRIQPLAAEKESLWVMVEKAPLGDFPPASPRRYIDAVANVEIYEFPADAIVAGSADGKELSLAPDRSAGRPERGVPPPQGGPGGDKHRG